MVPSLPGGSIMTSKELSPELRSKLRTWQRNEITEHHIYMRLADSIKDPNNRKIVQSIAVDEEKHAQIFKRYTGEDVKPNRFKIGFYYWIARIFGLTFGIKLMEKGEEQAQVAYMEVIDDIPEIETHIEDEEKHEHELLEMLDEEVLKYMGSVVLGLNDALVELTGTLAGLTFAFQNTTLIALSGLITGISASLSMAASEYLSSRAEGGEPNPLRSSLYTGIAYIFTVIVLVFPYFILNNYLICLGWTLINAILVIAVFNYYLSVAKDLNFGKRFLEMAAVSLGVALISFGIGFLIRQFFGFEI
jgi:VIT1/CCC1 family predicted Fe2+/Mn2+ transporter